ncbi:MAG: hypothetical protein R2727_07110 [Bacteroidales bacterium]
MQGKEFPPAYSGRVLSSFPPESSPLTRPEGRDERVSGFRPFLFALGSVRKRKEVVPWSLKFLLKQ